MCVSVCCVAVGAVCLLLFLLFALSCVCLVFAVVLFFVFCLILFCFSFFFLFFVFYQAALCGLWALGSLTRGGPGPSGWEHRVQDVGKPENSQAQGILSSMGVPEVIHINTKTLPHTTACRLQ